MIVDPCHPMLVALNISILAPSHLIRKACSLSNNNNRLMTSLSTTRMLRLSVTSNEVLKQQREHQGEITHLVSGESIVWITLSKISCL